LVGFFCAAFAPLSVQRAEIAVTSNGPNRGPSPFSSTPTKITTPLHLARFHRRFHSLFTIPRKSCWPKLASVDVTRRDAYGLAP
jgi:hypothetical protein